MSRTKSASRGVLETVPREMRVNGKTAVVESDTTLVPAPSLDALAATIRHEHDLTARAGQKMLEHAVLCGDALREAKTRVETGGWYRWLDENVSFGRQTAAFYLKASFYADLANQT